MRSQVSSLIVVFGRNTGLGRFREQRASWRLFSFCSIKSWLVNKITKVLGSKGSRVF